MSEWRPIEAKSGKVKLSRVRFAWGEEFCIEYGGGFSVFVPVADLPDLAAVIAEAQKMIQKEK